MLFQYSSINAVWTLHKRYHNVVGRMFRVTLSTNVSKLNKALNPAQSSTGLRPVVTQRFNVHLTLYGRCEHKINAETLRAII